MVHFKEDWYSKFATNEELSVFLFICCNANEEGYLETSYQRLIDGTRINMKKGSKFNSLISHLVDLELISISRGEKKMQFWVNEPSKVIFRANIKKSAEKEISLAAVKAKPKTKEESYSAFEERLREVYPNVSRMKNPLSFDDWNKLADEGYTKEEIIHILEQLDNYRRNDKPCYMCYNSALSTMRNWLKNERKRQTG